ncbi:hypothetical protein CDV55_105551 [Aspergillus turcosus]|nr:hypothetical protein CDV55_105551 [Aspergillus turcosus]
MLLADAEDMNGRYTPNCVPLEDFIGVEDGRLVWGGSNFIDSIGEGRIYLEDTEHGPKMVAEMKKEDGLREIQTIELSEKIANVGGRLQYIIRKGGTWRPEKSAWPIILSVAVTNRLQELLGFLASAVKAAVLGTTGSNSKPSIPQKPMAGVVVLGRQANGDLTAESTASSAFRNQADPRHWTFHVAGFGADVGRRILRIAGLVGTSQQAEFGD